MADVTDPTYGGVPVTHPRIVEAIQTLAKIGKSKEEIMKVVGMPEEIVRRYAPAVRSQ